MVNSSVYSYTCMTYLINYQLLLIVEAAQFILPIVTANAVIDIVG